MTDKELLELAAKAAGIVLEWVHLGNGGYGFHNVSDDFWNEWNPLTDDGDALRLAVKLGIDITVSGKIAAATGYINGQCFQEYANGDLQSATRRAIVRAAAEIGKGMLTHDQFVMMFPSRFRNEEVLMAYSNLGKAMP